MPPTFRRGDMLKEISSEDVLLFTANACLDKNDCLIMGAGFAKVVREFFPDVPFLVGQNLCGYGTLRPKYGVEVVYSHGRWIGAFQTKSHWRSSSSLQVITHSVETLLCHLRVRQGRRYHLNYPGIGLGGLPKKDVTPLLKVLPDRVTIWECPNA